MRTVFTFKKKEGHKIWKWPDTLTSRKNRSTVYEQIILSEHHYQVDVVISKNNDVNEPWIIVTNGNYRTAIKDYSYRFSGIEPLFKSQKSNGFYLENTINASQKYFETMYTMLCFASLFLTIIGADFSKNTKCYKNVKLTTHQIINNKKTRIMSLFQIGLTLFTIAFNSSRYVRIPFKFILYDIWHSIFFIELFKLD